MLQTIPESANCLDANLDIFDGFGNAGMGVASNLPNHFDTKRIEELNSNGDNQNGPFSPHVMQGGMEFPGLGEYNFTAVQNNALAPRGRLPIRQSSNNNAYGVIQGTMDFHHDGMRMGDMDMQYR